MAQDTIIREETKSASQTSRTATFVHALAFVFGFSLIFIVGWGGAATIFGQMFSAYKSELAQIGGIIIIVFGLVNLGILRIPLLFYDTRPEYRVDRRLGFFSSGLMGIFFAAGWTPCIGTTLGAILTMGFSQETSAQAMVLASGYALGMGIPFLIIGLGVGRFAAWLKRFRRHMRKVQVLSGILLIGIGFMLLTNQLTAIAIWAQRNGFYADVALGGATTPTYFIAIIAGLVSFLSPCVLPLVPAYIGYLSGHAVRDV